jgi:transposase
MRTITFTQEDLRELAHDRYHYPDPRVQRKMEVLWLKSHGVTHEAIATYAGVSRRSVQRYLDQYLEGGLPALRRCEGNHPQSVLVEHETSLEEYFQKHPPRSTKQARAIIEQHTGVRRGLSQVRHFLKDRLGLRWRKVGAIPVPPKKGSSGCKCGHPRICGPVYWARAVFPGLALIPGRTKKRL